MNKITLIKKHTINTNRYKNICLILLSLTLVLSFFLLKTNAKTLNIKLTFTKDMKEELFAKTIKPSLKGSAVQGWKYDISAKHAILRDEKNILLTDLIARIIDKDGQELQAISSKAVMNNQKKLLSLKKDIYIAYSGYSAVTKKLNIDFKKNLIYGKDKIDIKGENLIIEANNFDFLTAEGKLNFKGDVKFNYRPVK